MPIKSALVVDDSKSAGLMLRRMLEQNSLLVDVTESGEEALVYLRSKHPDVIFMDHIMPGMNGLEAAQAITKEPTTASIPIVMYTSKEGDAYVEQAKAHGVFGILPKPAKPAALSRIIQELNARPEAAPPAPAPVERPAAAASGRPAATGLRDEQLAQLRAELLAQSEQAAKRVASELARTLAQELRAELGGGAAGALTPALLAEVKQIASSAGAQQAGEAATEAAQRVARQIAAEAAKQAAGDIARHVANEIFQNHANELSSQFRKHVHDEITKLDARLSEPRSLGPAQIEEIRVAARTAALPEAADAARQAAQKLLLQAAQDIAKETNAAVTRQVARIGEQTDQLRKEVQQQLADVRAAGSEPRGISTAVLDEIKNVARTAAAQKAVEATHRAVTELGQQNQEGIRQAARQAVHDLARMHPAGVERSFVILAAAMAAAVGVLAAIFLH